MLRYVQRQAGVIVADFGCPQPGIPEEQVDDQSQEFLAYRAPPPESPRVALDAAECAADKQDANLVGDMNKTAQEISDIVDALFPGPTYTNGQRAFFRRVARMAQHGARGRKLRNGT